MVRHLLVLLAIGCSSDATPKQPLPKQPLPKQPIVRAPQAPPGPKPVARKLVADPPSSHEPARLLAISPAAHAYAVYHEGPKHDDPCFVRIFELDHKERAKVATPCQLRALALEPSGERLAIADEAQLSLVAVKTSAITRTVRVEGSRELAWGDAGIVLVHHGTVTAFDPASDKRRELGPGLNPTVDGLRFVRTTMVTPWHHLNGPNNTRGYVMETNTYEVVDVRTGAVTPVAMAEPTNATISISDTGVIAAKSTYGIHLFDPAGKALALYEVGFVSNTVKPALSPDGHLAAMPDNGSLYLYDLEARARIDDSRAEIDTLRELVFDRDGKRLFGIDAGRFASWRIE